MDILIIVGRILLGGFFVKNGLSHFQKMEAMTGYVSSKGLSQPKMAVIISGLMLLIGGLGIIFWVYVELSVFLLTVFLLATSFKMHAFWKETDPMCRMSENINFYKNLAILGGVLLAL